MNEVTVSVARLPGCEDISLPRYMTEKSAGLDVVAAVAEDEIILPGERKMIPTGLTIALPEGFEAQIRPRSGLAIKTGVTLIIRRND